MTKQPKSKWQRELLARPELKGKVIAIRDDQIIFVGNSFDETADYARSLRDYDPYKYSFYAVPNRGQDIRILTLKIKSLKYGTNLMA